MHAQFEGVNFIFFISGFMLNLCTVALHLCEPFFKNKSSEKYMKIETDYCASDACRFQLCNESTLPGGHIGKKKINCVFKKKQQKL